MLLTRNNLENKNLRKRTISPQLSVGPLTLRFITIIIIAVLCILYLAQSTQGAMQNYKLREMEQTKIDLERENERLEVDALRLQALKNVDVNKDKKDEEKQFVETKNIEYIEE